MTTVQVSAHQGIDDNTYPRPDDAPISNCRRSSVSVLLLCLLRRKYIDNVLGRNVARLCVVIDDAMSLISVVTFSLFHCNLPRQLTWACVPIVMSSFNLLAQGLTFVALRHGPEEAGQDQRPFTRSIG